jgi:hypothetical protein
MRVLTIHLLLGFYSAGRVFLFSSLILRPREGKMWKFKSRMENGKKIEMEKELRIVCAPSFVASVECALKPWEMLIFRPN